MQIMQCLYAPSCNYAIPLCTQPPALRRLGTLNLLSKPLFLNPSFLYFSLLSNPLLVPPSFLHSISPPPSYVTSSPSPGLTSLSPPLPPSLCLSPHGHETLFAAIALG